MDIKRVLKQLIVPLKLSLKLSSSPKVRKTTNYRKCTIKLCMLDVYFLTSMSYDHVLLCREDTVDQNVCVCVCRSVWMNVTPDLGVNPLFALLKQRYSTEASLQHRNLCDSPPGGLPQQVGWNGQQQLRPHQRWRQGLRQAEEKCPDVSTPKPSGKR